MQIIDQRQQSRSVAALEPVQPRLFNLRQLNSNDPGREAEFNSDTNGNLWRHETSSLMQLRMLARLHSQSGGLHLHSIWNQISSGTGVAAVVLSSAALAKVLLKHHLGFRILLGMHGPRLQAG